MTPDWQKEFPCAITLCDKDGVIIYMNDKSIDTFKEDGGAKLMGSNVLACHPEPARTKLEQMLASGEKNVYTIEKKGKKKMILQSPWYENGEYAGFAEITFEIPFEMPHFIRKG